MNILCEIIVMTVLTSVSIVAVTYVGFLLKDAVDRKQIRNNMRNTAERLRVLKEAMEKENSERNSERNADQEEK